MKFLNYGVSKKSRKLGIKPYSKRKVLPAHLQGDLSKSRSGSPIEQSGVFPRETKKIPSLNTEDFSPALKKDKNQYTGTNIVGIGTLHKSNPVPIFNPDHAVDLATMRRS